MVCFNFEGDVENIRPSQISFIIEVLEKRGFKGSKVIVEPVGKAGDNYIADVKRIIVKKSGETFKMIAKLSPAYDIMRMMTNTVNMFNNESVMYTEILPKFIQLQKSNGLPEEELFRYADCYGSFLEPPNEIILLEDLQLSNFVMLDRFQPLTDECVMSVLRNLAVFHSLSFSMSYKEPETFTSMKGKLQDMWRVMTEKDDTKLYFSHLKTNALAVLEKDEHKKVLKGSVTGIAALFENLSETGTDSKYTVIQQGDVWTNNIMFKLQDGVQSILIDYQLSKESSPVCDLLYIIFNGTDYKTRLNRFHVWIDYYHNVLDECLNKYGFNASLVYPRHVLDHDLKRYGKMLFGQCVLLADVLTKKSEDAAKIKDNMKFLNESQFADSVQDMLVQDDVTQGLFKKRIEELADSFLEFSLL